MEQCELKIEEYGLKGKEMSKEWANLGIKLKKVGQNPKNMNLNCEKREKFKYLG